MIDNIELINESDLKSVDGSYESFHEQTIAFEKGVVAGKQSALELIINHCDIIIGEHPELEDFYSGVYAVRNRVTHELSKL